MTTTTTTDDNDDAAAAAVDDDQTTTTEDDDDEVVTAVRVQHPDVVQAGRVARPSVARLTPSRPCLFAACQSNPGCHRAATLKTCCVAPMELTACHV